MIQTLYAPYFKERIDKKTLYILYFIFLLIVFSLNYSYPFIHDDYAYCFIYGDNSGSDSFMPTSERIQSFSDILKSQYFHYQHVNGRSFSHAIIQLFSGLLGKNFFNIVNTLIIGLLCIYFHKLSLLSNKTLVSTLTPILLIFLVLPFPGQTIFWMTGAINYLWGSTFSLIVLQLFCINKKPNHILKKTFWVIFAFTSAWINESISIPISAALFIYSLINHRSISKFQKAIVTCYCLGCLLIILSPGSNSRIDNEIYTITNYFNLIMSRIWESFYFFIKRPINIIVIISTTLLFIKKKNDIIKKNSLFLLIYLCSLLFLFLLGLFQERIYFFHILLSWTIIMRYFHDIFNLKYIMKHDKILTILLGGLLTLSISNAFIQITYYNKYNAKVVNSIKCHNENCLITQIKYDSSKIGKYVYVTKLSNEPNRIHNRIKAFYYKKNYIAAWPKEVFDFINVKSLVLNNCETKTLNIHNRYLLILSKKEGITKLNINLKYQNDEYNNLSKRQIITRKILGSYNNVPLLQKKYSITPIYKNGLAYVLIPYTKYEHIEYQYEF